MAKYTTEVRSICESEAGYTESAGFNEIENVLTLSAPKIFNFDFPIFDESYRLTLEKRILREYYTREICEETVGLWKLRLQNKLLRIMPYYNKMYETTLYEFNPLYDVDLTTSSNKRSDGDVDTLETITKERDYDERHGNVETTDYEDNVDGEVKHTGTTLNDGLTEFHNQNKTTNNTQDVNTNAASNRDRWDLYSDTPQGGITGIANATDSDETLINNAYLTNARHIVDAESVDTITVEKTGTITLDMVGNGTDTNLTTHNLSDKEERNATGNKIVGNNGNRNGTESENTGRTSKNTISNVDEYTEHVMGKRGSASYASLIKEFRETIIDIDDMILDELGDLFMLVW